MPSDPTLYLYTTLTAGSSHIITATSRIETILKAHKIPFKAVDCATDDKARMLWQRRSKGRKLPGLVKFNDVIADYEAIEDLNEHGELEDHIEDQIDIFGDVPISATSKEAHETAAARAKMQAEAAEKARQESAGNDTKRPEIARTASETRHISIAEPTTQEKERKDSVSVMAMKAASAEAAKKAGDKKAATAAAAATPPNSDTQKTVEADGVEVSPVEVGAKTPDVLAEQGAKKTSVDKIEAVEEKEKGELEKPGQQGDDGSLTKVAALSNEEQIADLRRKSSVVEKPSGLAQSTSVDEDEEEEEEEEDEETGKEKTEIGATDVNEGKAKTQDQKAADGDKAGVSVGD